jgi:hypothetical protein
MVFTLGIWTVKDVALGPQRAPSDVEAALD